MIWPFRAHHREDDTPASETRASEEEGPAPAAEPPDEYQEVATTLLKRAYAASIGRKLNEDFVVSLADDEEERLQELSKDEPLSGASVVFGITCSEAYRYGLQVVSAYNAAYTFSRL